MRRTVWLVRVKQRNLRGFYDWEEFATEQAARQVFEWLKANPHMTGAALFKNNEQIDGWKVL
jgi:hypothetical protein